MGRRARKRGEAAATPAPVPGGARRAAVERPRAPWHPVPLVELSVLVGLVLLVWGLFRRDREGGRVMLVCGMVLASLGGLETALREHFSGFAPHSLLLAALPAVLITGVLFFAGAPWIAIPIAGALVLGTAFAVLRRSFRARR